MPVRWLRVAVFAGVILIAFAAGSGVVATIFVEEVQAQVAVCTASPTTVEPGETVTLDASDSDANYVEFDTDGDGEYERVDDTDFIIDVTYSQSGTYNPVARADGEVTDACGTITVNEPPSATLSVTPSPATTGEGVTFDASNSTDTDGEIVEYRWDFEGDGNIDTTSNVSEIQHTYSTADVYVPRVTVVDDDGATSIAEQDLLVEQSVVARCAVEPSSAAPGETVTIDATDSEGGNVFDYDPDGDGEYEVLDTTNDTLDWQYEAEATYQPRVRVSDGDRSDTAECGDVVIEAENEPPIPALSISPRPGFVGEAITFDASNASDPDGQIVEYRWDFDGDGTIENTTSRPITTYTYQQADLYVPAVTVVDDDNATSSTRDELPIEDTTVTPTPTQEVRCTVEPTSAAPGESILIDASDSTGVTVVDYDTDGDGEYERLERTNLTTTVVYEAAGTYTPRVRVHNSDQVTDCGTTIIGGNEPPIATFTVDPFVASPGQLISFNASESRDPDGRIVEYRWDFNGNGSIDAATNGSLTQHTYPETSRYRPVLVVVDNDGATDRAELTVRVVSERQFPGLQWLLPAILGSLLGFLICRSRHFPRPFGGGTSGGGVIAQAAGTFETPPGGGTVTVDGVGFEPDLLLFTATNRAKADGPTLDRTDGWTYGRAKREEDGEVVQHTVAVAEDARRADAGIAAASSSQAIDLLVHDDQGAYGLQGAVETTTDDGFEMNFDASELPDEHAEESFFVVFRAIKTAEPADVDAGFFLTPGTDGVQTVEIGTDADYVELAAVEPLGKTDGARVADGLLGVSHGVAVAESGINQQVMTDEVDATPMGRNSHAAFDDRALHLLHGSPDGVEGRTTARLTDLGEQLELTYDEVYVPQGSASIGGIRETPLETAASSGGREASGEPTAPPRLVSYLAIDTGDGPTPTIGHVQPPAPGEGPTRIDAGFEPEVVGLTAGTADRMGTERTAASPLSFGWSHGVAMIDRDGSVDHHVLHSSVSADEVSVSGPIETPATRTAAVSEHPGTAAAADGGRATESARSDRHGAGAVGFVLDDDGRIVGRDQIRVTAVDRTGFAIETERVGAAETDIGALRPSVVLYTAWPREEHQR